MSGKLEFGCDYLHIVRTLELRHNPSEEDLDPVSDAAARLFLLNWGFTAAEVNDANKLFWNRVDNKTLEPNIDKVIDRVCEYIKGDQAAQYRLVIELAAIGLMDDSVTDDEVKFVSFFKDRLDLKQSEFIALCSKGEDWSLSLQFFGKAFMADHQLSTE